MKYKYLLFSWVFILSFSTNAQDYWEDVLTGIDSTFARSMYISSNGDIYLGMNGFSYPGGIYRSSDNAATWQYLGLGDFPVYAVEVCPNGDIIAGVYHGMYKSTDNGETWYEVYFEILNVSVIKSLANGYVFAGGGGNLHGILRSTDFGETWDTCHVFTNYGQENLMALAVSAEGHIWAGTHNFFGVGSIWYTTDMGDTWTMMDTPCIYNDAFALAFHPQGDLFVGFFGEGLYRYNFSTLEWTAMYYPVVSPNTILFVGNNKIFAGLDDYPNYFPGIIYSDDGGQNFEMLNSGINNGNGVTIYNLFHHPDNLVYTQGLGVYRSIQPVFTGTKEQSLPQIVQSFNYPNPFKDKTSLTWDNSTDDEFVKISLIDEMGKILFQKNVKNSGRYSIDLTSIDRGVYFYSISEKSQIHTGKMVLVK
ncbi:MAG: T9SS type A sorting domain-containing protein [Bacteroidales bacterium]|nr:T9SS type A sorting domain-containing protein [Bacteroidales bacterium]MCF8404425.1 T9SS type A sorting domain-containing protein [Bacteroidales bacterium]